jgi:hypothetical protein
MSKTLWGFDLTSFNSAAAFKVVLIEMGLPVKAKRTRARSALDRSTPLDQRPFVWKRPGLRLVTGNNPITGAYRNAKQRPNEKGYASYIGIEGNDADVRKLAKLIKQHANYIKDESKGASHFIS